MIFVLRACDLLELVRIDRPDHEPVSHAPEASAGNDNHNTRAMKAFLCATDREAPSHDPTVLSLSADLATVAREE